MPEETDDPAADDRSQEAPLVAEATPELPRPPSPDELLDGWDRLHRRFAQLLAQHELDAAWLVELTGLAGQMRELADREPDGALYLLFHAAAHDLGGYSARHAMACAVVAELAARWLGWSDDEIRSLAMAALTMNVSMTAAQDTLAHQRSSPSDEQRRLIEGHARASAEMLRVAGVHDPVWLAVVEQHHTVVDAAVVDAAEPAPRLAELLRRVDVYIAKLSRRKTREAASPAIAARDACLGSAGHPDSIGATLLRVLGLYPPGTCVALANGELAVVVRRGNKAHTPLVASLRRADGGLLLQPAIRDCSLRSYSVRNGLRTTALRVRVNHLRVLTAASARPVKKAREPAPRDTERKSPTTNSAAA